MSSRKCKDFDAAFAERRRKLKGESPRFKLGGKTYVLPPELPAAVPIMALRMKKKYGPESDFAEDDVLGLAESLLGEAQLDEILASKVSVEELGEVIQFAIESYAPEPSKDQDEPGNPGAPDPAGETST